MLNGDWQPGPGHPLQVRVRYVVVRHAWLFASLGVIVALAVLVKPGPAPAQQATRAVVAARAVRSAATVQSTVGAVSEPDKVTPAPGTSARAGHEPSLDRAASRKPSSVVLLVLDGIRWQDVFLGVDQRLAQRGGLAPERIVEAARLVPHLHALAHRDGAAIGAPGRGEAMHATGPVFKSMPSYMELFAGQPARECLTNRCGRIRKTTLVDELAEGLSPSQVVVLASWQHMVKAAAMQPRRALISSGRTTGHNLELLRDDPRFAELFADAVRAGPAPSKQDFRADRFTAQLGLEYLTRVKPRFLFVGVAEADAFGHSNNYPFYLDALQRSDRFVGDYVAAVERLNAGGWPTTLIVTTDHGRDKDGKDHGAEAPSSSRIWLMATGFGVVRRGLVASPLGRRLADVAPTLRALLDLPPDRRPGAGQPITELFAAAALGPAAAAHQRSEASP